MSLGDRDPVGFPRRPVHRRSDGRRLRHRLHPIGWVGPVSGSALTVVAWSAVSRSSGSGWVQAVGALLAAILVTGLVAPAFPTLRSRITCTLSPSDGVAGRGSHLTLIANGPIRVHPLEPSGPLKPARGRARGPREITLEVIPAARGIVDSVAVELASSAPFGLMWWAKEVIVPLPRPLYIAPRAGLPGSVVAEVDDAVGEVPGRQVGPWGEIRGVRPYRPGDLRRAIHWPATAHTGAMMVTEPERPSSEPVTVEVLLPAEPEAAEREAERGMSAAMGHLANGMPVLLVTFEPSGRVSRRVLDRIELGRRLARAVPAGTDLDTARANLDTAGAASLVRTPMQP